VETKLAILGIRFELLYLRTPLLRLINPVERVVPSIRLIDDANRFPVLSVKVERNPGTGV
jgi:hypothetical protein